MSPRPARTGANAVAAFAALAAVAAGSALADVKPIAARVSVDEQVGRALPRELILTDQEGRARPLGAYLDEARPLLLSLAYYHCPGLCDVTLRELATRLRAFDWRLGRDYRALTVSIDPRDTPPSAAAKRANVLGLLGTGTDADWPFSVAREAAIKQLTAALGYGYDYDAATRQYAHPAVSIVVTPDGRVARYLYGPTYDTASLGLALREARAGRGGASALVDRTIMSCFRYDPSTRRYEWVVLGVMRLGAAACAVLLAGAIAYFIRRGRARRSLL